MPRRDTPLNRLMASTTFSALLLVLSIVMLVVVLSSPHHMALVVIWSVLSGINFWELLVKFTLKKEK